MTAGAAYLISEKFDGTLVYPVVVRLDNTLAVFVAESKQSFLLYCWPDERIDVQFWFRCMVFLSADSLARQMPCPETRLAQDASNRCSTDIQSPGDFRLADILGI